MTKKKLVEDSTLQVDALPPRVEITPISQQILDETTKTFETFKQDESKLIRSIKDRKEKIEILQSEQSSDIENLLRIRGALSALQHMVTWSRNKIELFRGHKDLING